MRFLLLNTDYGEFLDWLYATNPGLCAKPYDEQSRVRADSLFSVADFWSTNLRKFGHEAWEISINNQFLQHAWAREHGVRVSANPRLQLRLRRGLVPWIVKNNDPWYYEILAAQIRHYKPDVLINHGVLSVSSAFLRKMRRHVRLLIGYHGSPLPKRVDLGCYDLMLSVVDNFVDHFRSIGLQSKLLRLAFEGDVLNRVAQTQRTIGASFVGNVFSAHVSRRHWLEHVSTQLPLQVWVPLVSDLDKDSPIMQRSRGAAWGVEMFEILSRSQITLNHHIDVAADYAGNVRLFEATGVGALLITDWKKNLSEMFEPGKEVVAYRTPQECVEMVQYYLDHDKEREAIARAGQQRTLLDHTHHNRMEELIEIVREYI